MGLLYLYLYPLYMAVSNLYAPKKEKRKKEERMERNK